MSGPAGRLMAWALAGVALAGCGGSSRTAAAPASVNTHVTPQATATVVPPPPPKPKSETKPRPKPKSDPGSLPQTDQLPSASTPGFHAEMSALWNGIRADSVRAALSAFFPEAAYAQVKQIADPQSDWSARLVGDYRLDIDAAHALLEPDSAAARLVAVLVPRDYAHWVPAGACYNGVGYYEVPNARLIYRERGEVRSFGIASMISWRGVWYVVHLGAVVRAAATGIVDDPSTGAGTPTRSSTC